MTLEQNRKVLAKIKETKVSLSDNLLTGKASDYADYRRMVGVGEGLEIAASIIREVINDDEED